MAFPTVEPGSISPPWREDIQVPERYLGIGIVFEDDVLITKDGPLY